VRWGKVCKLGFLWVGCVLDYDSLFSLTFFFLIDGRWMMTLEVFLTFLLWIIMMDDGGVGAFEASAMLCYMDEWRE
jgi:hypothetical protein